MFIAKYMYPMLYWVFERDGMSGSGRSGVEETLDYDKKRLLAYLAQGPVKARTRTEVKTAFIDALKMGVERVEGAIASLANDGLISISTFTSYSPATGATETGYSVQLNSSRPSEKKLSKKVFRVPMSAIPPRKEEPFSLRRHTRVDGLTIGRVGRHSPLPANTPNNVYEKNERGPRKARKAGLMGADRASTW